MIKLFSLLTNDCLACLSAARPSSADNGVTKCLANVNRGLRNNFNISNMKRVDSRTSNSIRTMSSSSGLLQGCDGSAKFQFGTSSIICGVLGPTAVKLKDELMDKAFIKIEFTPLAGGGGTQDRLYERILEQTAASLILTSLYPRTMIKISLQVLSQDGSILATAVNAMILALLDAGVPMKSMASSVTCMIHKSGELLLDPTELEIQVSNY